MAEVYVEDFMSPGCVGCPAAEKILTELVGELPGEITIEKVDVTVDTARAMQYGIMSVPAIAVNGELKFSGVPKKEDVRRVLQEALKADG